MIILTPNKLVKWLRKYYSYEISPETALKALIACEEYGDEFSEDELIGTVEEYMALEEA
jgi:hypothetical protein